MQASHTDSGRLAAQQSASADDYAKISCSLSTGARLVSLREFRNGLEQLGAAKALLKGMSPSSPAASESRPAWSDDVQTKSMCSQQKSMLDLGADVHYSYGVALQNLKEYQEAVLDLKASVDLYLRGGRNMLAAKALVSLSVCYQKVNDADNELKSLLNARHIYNKFEETESEAFVCVELAKAHVRAGKMEECRTLVDNTLTLCLMVTDRLSQGMCVLT